MTLLYNIHGKQSSYIRDIIKETKRWESMPNRKEPVTKEMVERHDEEYATFKSGYSNRANLDSEYLEDLVIENIEGAERVEGKDRYFADVVVGSHFPNHLIRFVAP